VVGGAPAPRRVGLEGDPLGLEEPLHLRGRDGPAGAERHELDEAGGRPEPPGEAGEVAQLGVVRAADDHHVELHRGEPGAEGRLDPRDDPVEGRGAAGDPVELPGVERVERDVEARDPRLPERRGEAPEEVAVRGERDLLDPGGRADVAHHVEEVLAEGGLAAGEPDAPDAERGEDRDQPGEIGARERVLAALRPRRRAVAALEVAAVGERQPEVGDPAPLGVEQRIGGGGGARHEMPHTTRGGPSHGSGAERGRRRSREARGTSRWDGRRSAASGRRSRPASSRGTPPRSAGRTGSRRSA